MAGLALDLADRIHVLDYGRTLASGSPAQVLNDPAVVAAYLGEPFEGDPGAAEVAEVEAAEAAAASETPEATTPGTTAPETPAPQAEATPDAPPATPGESTSKENDR